MPTNNYNSTLAGLFKEVYAEQLDYLSNVYLRLIYKDSVLLIVLDEEEKKNE